MVDLVAGFFGVSSSGAAALTPLDSGFSGDGSGEKTGT